MFVTDDSTSWEGIKTVGYYNTLSPLEECDKMLEDTFLRLACLVRIDNNNPYIYSNDHYNIKVIKAWISPEAAGRDEWAYAQGRALDFRPFDQVTGVVNYKLLPRLASIASHLFDWVEHVPANPVTEEEAYIHVSRRFEAPTLAHPIITNDDLSEIAEAHWKQITDFNDTELLDQLINRFPGTPVCEAALSYRYDLLVKSVDRFMESGLDPESHVEWKSESNVVIRGCHHFLLNFPGKNGSENVRTLLFKVLRRLEDAYADRLETAREKLNVLQADPTATEEQLYALQIQVNLLELDRGVAPEYHEYAVRYPASIEGRLAFARLYALESERAKRDDSTEGYLSFMRDYPDAPQWDEIAERARDSSVVDEQEIIRQLELQAETDKFEDVLESRAAIVFRNQAERIKTQLIELLPDEEYSGTGARETTTAYSNPNLARFLIEALLRMKYVAGKMSAYYLDLFADLGSLIDSAMIQLRLAAIQIQISDLSKLVKQNHLEITDLVIRDGNETREQLSKSFHAIAVGQTELSQDIKDGFTQVKLRFNLVDAQLKQIYENTEEILVRADEILANQLKAKEQLDAMEEAIIDVNDAIFEGNQRMNTILKRVDEIKLRSSSSMSASGGGWLGETGRWVSGGYKKVAKVVVAEVRNLTAENIERWARDPGGTVMKRCAAGINNLEAEIDRGIRAAKSNWLYRKIINVGEHMLLEEPGASMEEINPNPDFDDRDLPFDRPNFDEDRPVYFINGVNNSRYEARLHAQYLADLQNVRVRLIYNYSQYHKPHSTTPPGVRSSYGNNDLLECIYDRLWPAAVLNAPKLIFSQLLFSAQIQENPSSRHLAYQIFHDIKNGKDVRIVAHSQGTLIARNALLACQVLQGSLNKVSCVLLGPALSDNEMIPPTLFANLTWIINRRDSIASLIGLQANINLKKSVEYRIIIPST